MDAIVSGSMKDQCSPAASHVQHSFAGSETERSADIVELSYLRGIKGHRWKNRQMNTPFIDQPGGIEFCGMIVVMRDGLFVST